MLVDTYKSTFSSRKYISVPADSDISQLTFLENLDPEFRELILVQRHFDAAAWNGKPGFDLTDMIHEINRNGYSIRYGSAKA